MKKLNRGERDYFSKLLRQIICNPKSPFFSDALLMQQWLKLNRRSKRKNLWIKRRMNMQGSINDEIALNSETIFSEDQNED